jgi:hypothetical protein
MRVKIRLKTELLAIHVLDAELLSGGRRPRLSEPGDRATSPVSNKLSGSSYVWDVGGAFLIKMNLVFCWLQGGRNLLAGHTLQASKPDCRRPTAPPHLMSTLHKR